MTDFNPNTHPDKCQCEHCIKYWDDYNKWWKKKKETEYETIEIVVHPDSYIGKKWGVKRDK